MNDPYSVLGISRGATDDEIKKDVYKRQDMRPSLLAQAFIHSLYPL